MGKQNQHSKKGQPVLRSRRVSQPSNRMFLRRNNGRERETQADCAALRPVSPGKLIGFDAHSASRIGSTATSFSGIFALGSQ